MAAGGAGSWSRGTMTSVQGSSFGTSRPSGRLQEQVQIRHDYPFIIESTFCVCLRVVLLHTIAHTDLSSTLTPVEVNSRRQDAALETQIQGQCPRCGHHRSIMSSIPPARV